MIYKIRRGKHNALTYINKKAVSRGAVDEEVVKEVEEGADEVEEGVVVDEREVVEDGVAEVTVEGEEVEVELEVEVEVEAAAKMEWKGKKD